VIHVDDGRGERTVEYDALLVAVGRSPRSADLGLDQAGVHTDARGFVTVDGRLRTSQPRIWAAGDVTPHPQFTHVAGVHASLAASNAVLGLRRSVDLRAIPRVTYTDPEVASVGASTGGEDTVDSARLVTCPHVEVDRAVTEGRVDGFARLAMDRKRRVIGATVVGPRAGEVLAELTLAVRKRMKVTDIAATIHPYPTYGDGPWNAAISSVRERFSEPRTARIMSWIVGGRRQWLDARGARR
jgi:pyruvate/2-oxoglutarate dehydrogenase complex dihydrolipoamide dehydrogenase (E3) component